MKRLKEVNLTLKCDIKNNKEQLMATRTTPKKQNDMKTKSDRETLTNWVELWNTNLVFFWATLTYIFLR